MARYHRRHTGRHHKGHRTFREPRADYNHCKICGKNLEGLPFTCRHCGSNFCLNHRLPEEHHCPWISDRSYHAWKPHTYESSRKEINFHHEEHHFHKRERFAVPNFIKEGMKFVPILGIIVLFMLYSYTGGPLRQNNSNNPIIASFDFSNIYSIFFTLIFIIILITGYQYWLLRNRFVRHNRFLVKIILISLGLWVFSRHVFISSTIGGYYDWLLLIISSWAVISATLLTARKINSINLASDLSCWGLRLLGGIFVFVGFMILMMGSMAFIFTAIGNVTWHSQGVFWVIAICLMLLGAFCEFRSVRRFPMMGIWRAD